MSTDMRGVCVYNVEAYEFTSQSSAYVVLYPRRLNLARPPVEMGGVNKWEDPGAVTNPV